MPSEIIDLTHTLDDNISVYPGDPSFACHQALTIRKDGNAVSSITVGSHTGTHIDAPSHFFEDGVTVDRVPLERLIGPAVVIDLSGQLGPRQTIEWGNLEKWEGKMRDIVQAQSQKDGRAAGSMLLIRTGWDQHWGTDTYFDHPFLSKEAAQRILATGITLIGVDTLSPDETVLPSEAIPEPVFDFSVHNVVLGVGFLIAENLTNLGRIADGQWIVNLLPLKIGGCDGSPIRACAWKAEDA